MKRKIELTAEDVIYLLAFVVSHDDRFKDVASGKFAIRLIDAKQRTDVVAVVIEE